MANSFASKCSHNTHHTGQALITIHQSTYGPQPIALFQSAVTILTTQAGPSSESINEFFEKWYWCKLDDSDLLIEARFLPRQVIKAFFVLFL
jgi:hypothetical protein